MKLSKSKTVFAWVVFPLGNANAKKLRTKNSETVFSRVSFLCSKGGSKTFINCIINLRLIQNHFSLKQE